MVINNKLDGPVNVVRMEGQINGIKKVIYLFMDMHYKNADQSSCDMQSSINIVDYFYQNFLNLNKTNKMYDFFVEFEASSYAEELPNTIYGRNTKMYIFDVFNFFRKYFGYERDTNKVVISHLFNNVRFHYIDIRDWIMYFIFYILENFEESITKINIGDAYLNKTIKCFKDISNYLKFVRKTLIDPPNIKDNHIIIDNLPYQDDIIKNKMLRQKIYEKTSYLIHKMIKSYKNDNIKFTLQKIVNNIIIKELDEQIRKADEYYSKYRKINNTNKSAKLLKYITKDFDELFVEIRIIFSKIMDIYFLRRFLDKNYITNAIVYAGAFHIRTYISILAKLFDFKITHVVYSVTNDLQQLNNLVKKYDPIQNRIKDLDNAISKLFKMYDTYNVQCSDVSNFPRYFI